MVVGYLLLLHDITAQKQAQAKFLEQQRSLAMLHEREQLARELHDGLGQVLGYIKIQGQAARDLLAQNKASRGGQRPGAAGGGGAGRAGRCARVHHGSYRHVSQSIRFSSTLQKYLETFGQRYQLRTELIAPPEWSDEILEPTAEMQLLRIIQEALTNARKHAQAKGVQVSIELCDSNVKVIIADDGVGFDPEFVGNDEDQKYGLGFMRQRAQEVGGSVG